MPRGSHEPCQPLNTNEIKTISASSESMHRELQRGTATAWQGATQRTATQRSRRSPTTTAGTPATMAHSGTSLVTTAPMATTA